MMDLTPTSWRRNVCPFRGVLSGFHPILFYSCPDVQILRFVASRLRIKVPPMALKMALLFVLASFLLAAAARISSNDEEEALLDASKAIIQPSPAPSPAPAPAAPPAHHVVPVDEKECPGLCEVRCAKHSRPNHCHRVCQTCCRRCKCVPPGTAGNREMCGACYTDMTTHRNATKCP